MDTEIFTARIHDTIDICERTNKPKFLGFVSREESVLIRRTLENRNADFILFGGYDSAERVMLGCFPEWDDEKKFPIVPITFNYRKNDMLSHRDFLGSLMGLGLTRDSVGDILVEEGRAVVFVSEDISGFVLSQLEKVGRTGVSLSLGYSSPLPQKSTLAELTTTVASKRLDCIVSALCNCSRGAAVEKIEMGAVSVNSVIQEKATKLVMFGDTVTVRGKGKFIITSLEDKTRKNRMVLKYQKYV